MSRKEDLRPNVVRTHLISPPESGGVGGAVCAGQHRAALPAGALGHRAVPQHRAAAAVHLVIQTAGVT